MNILSKEENLTRVKKIFRNLVQFFDDYNIFMFMALILGIVGFFSIFIGGGPTYYMFITGFFSFNLITGLMGILYILGFCFLLIHFFSRILKDYENPEKFMKNFPNRYAYLSLFTFLSFGILMYIFFIAYPFPFHQGFVYIFGGGVYPFPPSFELGPGFTISSVLTCMIIASIIYNYIYNKIVLRQLYKTYLPMYAPKKYQNVDEFDEM